MALVLSGCGGDSDTPSSNGGEDTAASSAGEELVVLEDDEGLQTVDNIAAAVNAEALTDPLRQAIEKVTGALTTDDLVGLNRQVDLERKTPENVATAYLEENDLASGVSGGSGEITVGAANFGENQILANLFAGALDAAGFDASVQAVTNREVYEPALESGQLDVVPEYVGTFAEFLNKKKNGPEAEAVASGDLDATVEALRPLAEEVGIVVLEPSEAQDQNAFAVTKAFAEANDLTTLSDLAGYEGELVLGGPPSARPGRSASRAWRRRTACEFDEFVSLDAGGPLTKTALRSGEVQVGLVFSSDGSLSSR